MSRRLLASSARVHVSAHDARTLRMGTAAVPSSARQARIRPSKRLAVPPVPWPPSPNMPTPPMSSVPPPPDDVLPTYVAEGVQSPEAWGEALRPLIDDMLASDDSAGTLLVKGLPVDSPAAFGRMIAACGGATWRRRAHEPFGGPRETLDGVDLATNVPDATLLPCHNELSYNPCMPRIFVLACNAPAAQGGESLLARNADYTPRVPPVLQRFIAEHGGVRYVRRYADAAQPGAATSFGVSWQERAHLSAGQGRRDAEAYFQRTLGVSDGDLTWQPDDALMVTNTRTGFNHRGDWCNVVNVLAPLGGATAGDGTPFPQELLEGLTAAEAGAYYAFKMERGDVWVADNLRVAHGRMPFVHSEPRRTLSTYLADPA